MCGLVASADRSSSLIAPEFATANHFGAKVVIGKSLRERGGGRGEEREGERQTQR